MLEPEEVGRMVALHEMGWGSRRIARELGVARNTVKRHVVAGGYVSYRAAAGGDGGAIREVFEAFPRKIGDRQVRPASKILRLVALNFLSFGCGVWLVLRAHTFPVVLGLTLLSYAVNLFLFATGRLIVGRPPVIGGGTAAGLADPLPQALVLTAIVIGFAMTAFVIMLALRARAELGNDHVDGESG